jgi:hypothetical protein
MSLLVMVPVAQEEDEEISNISPSPITQPPSPEAGPDSSGVTKDVVNMEEGDGSIYHPTPSTSSSPEPISDGDVDINLREEDRNLEVETNIDEEDPIPLISYTASYDENGYLILKRDAVVPFKNRRTILQLQAQLPKNNHQAQGIFANGHHTTKRRMTLRSWVTYS